MTDRDPQVPESGEPTTEPRRSNWVEAEGMSPNLTGAGGTAAGSPVSEPEPTNYQLALVAAERELFKVWERRRHLLATIAALKSIIAEDSGANAAATADDPGTYCPDAPWGGR